MITINADLTEDERIILSLALLNLRTRIKRDIILATQAGATDASKASLVSLETLTQVIVKLGMEDYV